MLPSLRAALRAAPVARPGCFPPAVRASRPLAHSPVPAPARHLGTHPHKEPMEPLNSARGAREFIYSLHPSERTCLLRELHRFESIAIAQGRSRPISEMSFNSAVEQGGAALAFHWEHRGPFAE